MRLLTIFISLFIFGCQPLSSQKEIKPVYFDMPGFSQELLASQVMAKSKVVKRTVVNGAQEKQDIAKADSSFWATELYLLINENINKPSLVDAYTIQKDVSEDSSNLKKTVYTALPESNAVIKKLVIKYLNNPSEIRQIFAEVSNSNSVYTTHQTFELWVNKYENQLLIDSLINIGFNKTILLDSMTYSSKVVVVR